MSWNDYTAFANAAQSAGLQFSYTVTESVPVRQSESIKPVGTTDDENADDTGGEFTLRGFYTLDAARANDLGRYRVVEGKHLSYSGRAPKGALISREVADANGLKVGDTFTVGHPTDADTTMEMTVRGIYEYVDDDAPSGRGDDARLSKDNRQNAIYVSAYTFIVSNNLDSGEETGWAKPDLNIMFMLSSPDDYQSFVKAAKKADAASRLAVHAGGLDGDAAGVRDRRAGRRIRRRTVGCRVGRRPCDRDDGRRGLDGGRRGARLLPGSGVGGDAARRRVQAHLAV